MIRGVQISFTDWDLLTPARWIGLDNYRALLSDEHFGNALVTTLIYVIVNIATQTVAGLGIAVLMQRISQSMVIRSLLLVPWLVPNVTVAVITLFVLDPNVGLVNHLLSMIGTRPIAFYGDPHLAIFTVALVNSWRNMATPPSSFSPECRLSPQWCTRPRSSTGRRYGEHSARSRCR